LSIDPSSLDNRHGAKILFLTGPIREPGITAGHFDILMTQKLLETFQAHSRIEKLGSEGVTKTMHRVALRFESCFLNVSYEPAPSGTVTGGLIAPAIKDKLFILIPLAKPAF
jgi:hypothetical protein